MDEGATSLLDALRARGSATCLRRAAERVGADELLAWIASARARIKDLGLRPGCVLGVRGRHPRARFAVPIAAWSLGMHTYFVSEREPETRLNALLSEAGCRAYVEMTEGGGVHGREIHGGEIHGGEVDWAEGPGRLILAGPAGTLLRTSGTSGTPKIAVHTLDQHLESARAAIAFLDLDEADSWLLSLPTWHVGGLGIVLRTLLSGATLLVPAPGMPLARALALHRPTHVSLVSTQLVRLLDAGAHGSLRTCRALLLGGGPLSAATRRRKELVDLPLVVSYGSTETSALIAASCDPAVIRRPFAAGPALPQREIRIDADGQILVGGPTLFRGYLRNGALVDPRDVDGLFATGDVGRIGEDGVLYVTGRTDRMFITGGENVHPEELEQFLADRAELAEAYVVSVPHPDHGRRPVAFVRRRAPISGDDLARYLREHVPGFKIPDAFYELPRDPGARGTPDLAELERRAANPEGLERI